MRRMHPPYGGYHRLFYSDLYHLRGSLQSDVQYPYSCIHVPAENDHVPAGKDEKERLNPTSWVKKVL